MSSFGLQRVVTTRQGSETLHLMITTASPSGWPAACRNMSSCFFGGGPPDWSFLAPDVQSYLGYFCDNITHYHYRMFDDPEGFFHTILVNIAIRNEGLLYALVGFAAYHHTLRSPSGRIKEFLQYYNRSVTLLLAFLKKGKA